MPMTVFVANTRAKAAEVDANFANTVQLDTSCVVAVSHTWQASQTFQAGLNDTGTTDSTTSTTGSIKTAGGIGIAKSLVVGAAITFATLFGSSTALATPSALVATRMEAFASTVSGAAIRGYGTTNDVALMNRAGTVVLGVGPNTTAVNIPGSLVLTGATVTGAPTWGSTQTLNTSGTAATVTTAAQPAITSVGTLTGLTMGGTLTMGANTLALASATVSGQPTWSSTQNMNISGNAATATTASGVAASALTGTTMASNVVTSSLTTIGTLVGGAVPASLVTAGTFPSGAFVFAGAVSGITTLATSSTINGQTISSAANFTGTASFAGKITSTVGNNAAILQSGTATTGFSYLEIANTTGIARFGVENSTGNTVITNGTAYATVVWSAGSTALDFGTTNIRRGGFSAAGAFDLTNGLTVSAGTTAVQALTATSAVVGNAGSGSSLTIGAASPSGDNSGTLLFATSNAVKNWKIASNGFVAGALSFVPSTANGGQTFTTPVLDLTSSAAAFSVGISATTGTFSSDIQSSTWIKMAGTTSSFPALKRVTTGVEAKLADDSAWTSLKLESLTFAGPTFGTITGIIIGGHVNTAVSFDSANYIQIAINGSSYKLALAT